MNLPVISISVVQANNSFSTTNQTKPNQKVNIPETETENKLENMLQIHESSIYCWLILEYSRATQTISSAPCSLLTIKIITSSIKQIIQMTTKRLTHIMHPNLSHDHTWKLQKEWTNVIDTAWEVMISFPHSIVNCSCLFAVQDVQQPWHFLFVRC